MNMGKTVAMPLGWLIRCVTEADPFKVSFLLMTGIYVAVAKGDMASI